MASGPDLIDAHVRDWAPAFAAEADRLRALLGTRGRSVEHIGATAVLGLPGRRELDIAVAVADGDVAAVAGALAAAGYHRAEGRGGLHADVCLERADGDPSACVRVVEADGASLSHHRLVRDYLRCDAAVRDRCARRRLDAAAADDDLRTYVASKVHALAALADAARDWRHPAIRGDGLRLRPSREADVDRIHDWIADPRVHNTWGGPWPREKIRTEYVDRPGDDHAFVIEDGAVPAGYIQYWTNGVPRNGGIDMFVAPECQGRGLGPRAARCLIRFLVRERGWLRVVIEPLAGNASGVRAWRRAGFELERERPSLDLEIDPPRPALLMSVTAAQVAAWDSEATPG